MHIRHWPSFVSQKILSCIQRTLTTMSELAIIDSLPPRYHEYLATQERVSVWVQSTNPSCSSHVSRRPASRKSTTDLRRSKSTKFILERSISKLPSPPPTPHIHNPKALKLSLKESKADLTGTPRRRHTFDVDLPSRKARRHAVDDQSSAEHESISPAVALLSTSLIVCAFLPSLLTVSAFVVLLTFANMETKNNDVRLNVTLLTHFNVLIF